MAVVLVVVVDEEDLVAELLPLLSEPLSPAVVEVDEELEDFLAPALVSASDASHQDQELYDRRVLPLLAGATSLLPELELEEDDFDE